ncbi:hypothetical protein D3C73_1047670 [compost metagenome]
MGGTVGLEGSGQMGFDSTARGVVAIVELNANASGTIALGTFGRDPGNFASHRNFLRFVHQVQQHEYLVTQLVALVGRDKQTAIPDERHVGRVKHGLVLDGQGQNAVARPLVLGFIHADLHC